MAIIAVMVALSSLLVIIFIVIILYMLRWVIERQPEMEAVLITSASVCVCVRVFKSTVLRLHQQVQEVQAGRKPLQLLQAAQRQIRRYR